MGRILFLCVVVATVLFSACGGDAFDTAGTGGQASTCRPDELECASQCVKTDVPAFGCGNPSCVACDVPHATAKCDALACVVDTCQTGYADCSAEPGCETDVNLPQSCGGCDVACGPSQVCDGGTCAASCSGGKENCGGACADLMTDTQHCGSCEAACTQVANSLPVCAAGSCTLACTSGFLDCNGKLADGCEINPSVDIKNCGACGTKCVAGEICSSGLCELTCGGGTTKCGEQCVDTNTDENNCGECGKPCESGQNCIAGLCDLNCGGGTTKCNGACVQLAIDPNNCGSCGNACGPTSDCLAGVCTPKCTSPLPTALFSDTFADGSKGWQMDTGWQIGATGTSSGHTYGNPDPGLDATGTTKGGVAGVKLAGNVPVVVQPFQYLTSPVINASGLTFVYLEYFRWLNSDYSPFMENRVDVFDGSIWVTIWQSGGSPGTTDKSWVNQGFDISAYANANLRVRFGYAITSTQAFVVSGWNVDNVTISTLSCQ